MAVKPKLALIPSGVKANKVYSVLPADGVGDFDFSRSGSATRINKDGLIETVDSNVPRLNYPMIDGVVSGCPSLLLEPQSLNSQTNSEDLSDASSFPLGAVSVSVNQIISPNGTLNADKLIESNTNARHELYGKSLNFSGTTSVSFFAKAAERRYISVFVGGDPNVGGATFDVQDGLITLSSGGTTSNIEKYPNGWYKCSFTSTYLGTQNVYYCLRDNGNAVDVQTYQGDGISGMYLWGFQTEIGQSYPTSYIPTTTSATTRSAETCNGAGDANTFNDSEGVLMVETSALANDLNIEAISINANNADNRLALFKWNVSNRIQIRVNIAGNTPIDAGVSVSNIEDLNKISLKYKSGDYALWINGFEVYVNSLADTPIGLSNLSFDSNGSNGVPFYGNTKQIQYFDTALTDTDLEELTSWTSFNEMAQAQLYKTY